MIAAIIVIVLLLLVSAHHGLKHTGHPNGLWISVRIPGTSIRIGRRL